MPDLNLKVSLQKSIRGKTPISILVDDEVVHSGRVDPFDASSIDSFVASAEVAIPGLNGQAAKLRKAILQQSKPKKKKAIPTPPASPNASAMPDNPNTRILDKSDPLPAARLFRAERYGHNDYPRLIYSADTFYEFIGCQHLETKTSSIAAKYYRWAECKKVLVKVGDEFEELPYKPTKGDKTLTFDALQADAYAEPAPPAWLIEESSLPEPTDLIVAPNGIFQIDGDKLKLWGPPTPRLFTTSALDYNVTLDSVCPRQWLEFLDKILPDDPEQIELLQEWFGYCLTADTSLQKALLMIGPLRCGKGTIARVLARLVGLSNVAAPTLAGMAQNFGLWPLIGKRIGIVSDARLSGQADQAVITERILSITGEDYLTIDRKNLDLLTMKLFIRLLIISNELPKLADASGALANRFVILALEESFLGREDPTLTTRLLTELPAILLWSIKGLARLRERGHFQQPSAGESLRDEMKELTSPVGAFVKDMAHVGAGGRVSVSDLFDCWRAWSEQQGRHDAGTKSVFGRDLRAAVPGIGTKQIRDEDEILRVFEGIRLTAVGQATMSAARARWTYSSGQHRQGAQYAAP